jgi:hypothetical protein
LVAFAVVVASLVFANFRLWDVLSLREPEVYVESKSAKPEQWLSVTPRPEHADHLTINRTPALVLTVWLNLISHDENAIRVRFSFDGIDSTWGVLDYAEISKAKLELRESTDRDFQPKDMITLEGRGIVPRLGIRVTVPCRIPDSEQTFRIWGSLTKLALKLKVAWAGKKPIPLVVEYDVAEVRKTMRQHVVTSCGAVVKRVFDKPDAKPNLSERIEEIMRISSELNGAD